MNRFKKLIIIILVLFLLIGTLPSSFAWFAKILNVTIPNDFSGSTEASYFESGDGSAETPYVISNRVHLYNLAWLQYLGYFNLGEDVNNKRAQNYFILKNDIDMDGLGIPPIGTEEYPFLGNFNGQGYTITDCVTANSKELLPERPSLAKFDVNDLISAYASSTDDVAQIIGFFGVVGDYNNAVNAVISSIDENTIGTLNTDAILARNFYLNNISVKTLSGNTTVGVAAGYVNAEFNSIGVCNSNIVVSNAGVTTLTENISDFTLVGYCTDKAKTSLKVSTVTLTVPKTSTEEWVYEGADGVEGGWGGSVDMKSMHARLQSIRGAATTNSNYVYDRYIEIGLNGQTNTLSEKTGTMYVKNNNPAQGSFVFSSTSTQYTYLHGGTTIFETKYIYGSDTTAYLISDGSGRYLSVNGTSITSSTDANTAAKWFFSAGQSGGYISTVTNGFLYYLTNTNGTLSLNRLQSSSWNNSNGVLSNYGYYLNYNTNWRLSTALNYLISDGSGNYLTINSSGAITNSTNSSTATVWTFANPTGSGLISAQANGSTYYLRYNNGLAITTTQSLGTSWTSQNGYIFYNGNYLTYNSGWTTIVTTYYISDGNGNYLTLNGTTLGNATSKETATVWTFSNGDSGGYISSGNVYLRYNSGLTTTTNTRYRTSWTMASNRIYTNTYYIKCSNGVWTASSGTTNATLSVFASVELLILLPQVAPLTLTQTTAKPLIESNRTYVDNTGTNVTYFPLQASDSSYEVIAKNTGYVISSSHDRTTTGIYPDKSGDIRVSYYGSSSINSTYISNGIINKILTINDSSTAVDITSSTAYKKLDKAKTNFEAVLSNDTTNLYGLHFMNASVSIDKLVTIPSLVINNTTYTNYKMPADSVDFRLKEKGYVNFFAGTYFPGNNSFFSLYDIKRDNNNNITHIKRITEVYADDGHQNYSYVYKYDDGTYSVAYKIEKDGDIPLSYTGNYPTGYSLKFKLSWIENNSLTSNALYYFELPVNKGEYALGSADGCVGSYLMYLDIGANAQNVERTVISETITTTTNTHNYANGVGIVETTANINGNTSVTDNDIVAYKLPAGSFGNLQLSRTGNAVTAGGISGIARFIATGLTFNSSSTATPDASVTTVEKRLTYVDYNVVTEETIITVISQINNNPPSMIVTLSDGSSSAEPYRKTTAHTDSANDINDYYNPSTITLLQYGFTVHEDAQVNIVYEASYQGTTGYNINVLKRNMLVNSTEDTTATILASNFIEDSGASGNHLNTTEVTVSVLVQN